MITRLNFNLARAHDWKHKRSITNEASQTQMKFGTHSRFKRRENLKINN